MNKVKENKRNIVLIISHFNSVYFNACCTESLYCIMDYLTGILDASMGIFLCIMYSCILFCRTSGRNEFERAIAERRERYRALDYSRDHSLLIPQTGEKTWGENRTFAKVDMVGEVTGFRHRIATKRDKHCMDKYLDNVSPDQLNVPKFGEKKDYLPVGAPLLDYLVEDVKNSEGWMFPKLEDLKSFQSHRGLSWNMTQEVQVKELICGVSSEGEIDEVRLWMQEQFELDQERFGSCVVSLDVEDVKATYHDTLRMAGKVEIGAPGALLQKKPTKESLARYGADGYKQIPGKIMFGNGITWMAVISLDMHRNRDGIYFLERMTVQQGILKILRNLPVSAGLGIRRDVRGIEEFYSLLADEPVELSNGFIDLAALSIAAGYKFHARNMTALGVQVIGTLLNKTVSTGDDMWGLRWSEIPESLCIYGIGDVRFGFMAYVILAGILLRDLYPDPDIVCWFLKCEQKEAVDWFLDWMVLSLEGVEYHQDAEARAGTREELFRTLRFRDARDKLCQDSPKYVKLWTRLLGAWPSITHGGCRYLIQCREWFLVQIRILARANIQWSDNRVIRVPTEADLEYARFGLSAEEIGFQSWTEPVTGSRGFSRPGSISVPLIDFDPSVVHSTRIGRLCTGIQRFQRWSILEWGRMNPSRLKFFFTRMMRNSGFRLFYKGLYDALRLMFLRIFDEPAPVVIRLEEELNEGIEKTYQEEKNALEKCETEVAIRRDRVAWMEEIRVDWNLKERTRWREGLPQLPVWKRRTKPGTKRVRSRSKSRTGVKKGAAKRRKVDRKNASHSVLVPVQPGSFETGSGTRDETDDVQADGAQVGHSSTMAVGNSEALGEPGAGGFGKEPGRTDPGLSDVAGAEPVLDQGESKDESDRVPEVPGAESVLSQEKSKAGASKVAKNPNPGLNPSSSGRRVRSRNRVSLTPRVLTYDEMIEGYRRVIEDDEPVGMNGEEFQFEIPAEMEKYDFEF